MRKTAKPLRRQSARTKRKFDADPFGADMAALARALARALESGKKYRPEFYALLNQKKKPN